MLYIADETKSDVNTCMFVDALDEHDGNHWDLVSVLQRLSATPRNGSFHLRVCLSGWQGNVFRDSFGNCPGFAIHELIAYNIRHYTRGRMQNALNQKLTEDGKLEYSDLIGDVIARAEGVFLWVRLVCDELIESLCEGDTIDELKELLSVIPTDLEALYTRALQRSSDTRSRRASRLDHERYVIFQIVLHCQRAFTPNDLLTASMALTTNCQFLTDLPSLSEDQMERRLYSRSGGLLEVVDSRAFKHALHSYAPFKSHSQGSFEVQFIHQTIKEYLIAGEGCKIMSQDVGEMSQPSGYALISQYLLCVLTIFDATTGFSRLPWIGQEFLDYASLPEQHDEEGAGQILEPTILALPEEQRCNVPRTVANEVCRKPTIDMLQNLHGRRHTQLVFFYAMLSLDRSFTKHLQRHKPAMTPEDFVQKLNGIAGLWQLETSPRVIIRTRYKAILWLTMLEVLLEDAAERSILRYVPANLHRNMQAFDREIVHHTSDHPWTNLRSLVPDSRWSGSRSVFGGGGS